jgi:predicted transcriptional regulator of viral defense system
MKKYTRLIDYLEDLRRKGKYLFLKTDACLALDVNAVACANSIMRLSKKGKVAHLKKGLYQIIPAEYANNKTLPPEWFIDDLMRYLEVPYYVALLTAATMHGSSHHAPQIFQVMCNKVMLPLTIGRLKIVFYYCKNLKDIEPQKLKVPSGYLNVSSPEDTAFDLLRYVHQSGHLNHVATVLSELATSMTADKLLRASEHASLRQTQRLGYILDRLGFTELTGLLAQKIAQTSSPYVALRSDAEYTTATKDEKWRLYINEELELDI